MSRVIIRQQIIRDCAVLFNCKGYQNVSFTDIEKISSQTKAVLFGYFENKQALARAVLEFNLNKKRELISQQVALQPAYINKLLIQFDLHNPESNFFPVGGCPILNAATETDYAQEEMRLIVAQALLNWKQDIINLISEGRKAGEFKMRSDIDEVAWSLISLIEGAVFISHTTQNFRLGRQLLEQSKSVFLKYFIIDR